MCTKISTNKKIKMKRKHLHRKPEDVSEKLNFIDSESDSS